MTRKAKVNPANVIAYITGKLRYRLYYSRFRFLIRTHIQEQIDLRVKFMNKACYENGECVICGCQTTALQMADKRCDDNCYPTMMTKGDWQKFRCGNTHWDGTLWGLTWTLLRTGKDVNIIRRQYFGRFPVEDVLKPNNNV